MIDSQTGLCVAGSDALLPNMGTTSSDGLSSLWSVLLDPAKRHEQGDRLVVKAQRWRTEAASGAAMVAMRSIFTTAVASDTSIYGGVQPSDGSVKLLVAVIDNLLADRAYADEYAAYLQGHYTEDEFADIAAQYAVPEMSQFTPEEIRRRARRLAGLLQRRLSSVDVAMLLGLDVVEVEDALTSMDGTDDIRNAD